MHAYSLRAIASCARNMSPSQQTAACVVIVRYDSSVPPYGRHAAAKDGNRRRFDKKVVWCRYCDSAAGPLC